jgi:spoIIIJ-associated protein
MALEKEKLKTIQKLTSQLLKLLGVEAQLEIAQDKEGTLHLQLETEDPGILIGYHGETLASLQLILAMMLYRQINEWTRVLVNVGDYQQRRRQTLEKMALSAAQRVKFSGEEHALPPMSSAERRLIHLALANEQEVETESEGEDRERRVIIKPKKKPEKE